MGFSGEPNGRDRIFRFLECTSKTIKKKKQKNNKKVMNLFIVYNGAGVCVRQKFVFFSTCFALFSPIICQSDGFSGIRIVSLILIFLCPSSRNGKKKVGYQKSHFFIFLVRFFVTIFVDFSRKSRFQDNTATFWPLWG